MSRTPMAMLWELIRQSRRRLTVARSIVSTDGDLLVGSGVADEIVTSWFAQGILWGLSKVMRHHVESGEKRFQEWSHMAIGMRFRAGAMGVPFMPIRSMLGSDVLKLRPEAKEIDCPFTGEKLLLVPALNPDVGPPKPTPEDLFEMTLPKEGPWIEPATQKPKAEPVPPPNGPNSPQRKQE